MKHARIQDGRVVEIIEPFERVQFPAPQPFPEDYEPTELEQAQFDEAQALHDGYKPGFVPIEERFTPDIVAACVPAPDGVSPGDLFDGEKFSMPPSPAEPGPPAVVTMRQARLALLAAGKYKAVGEAIAAIPGDEGEAARIEWEFADTVARDSALVASMASALKLKAADLDDLFVAAAAL